MPVINFIVTLMLLMPNMPLVRELGLKTTLNFKLITNLLEELFKTCMLKLYVLNNNTKPNVMDSIEIMKLLSSASTKRF